MAPNGDLPVGKLIVHDGPAYDARGQLVRVRIVSFMVGDYGPFGLVGLASELTNEEIRRRIHAEAEAIRALVAQPE